MSLTSALCFVLVCEPASAQQETDSSLTGRFRIGYRGVDVGGVEGKYRQHVNLDDGPRLFELRFDYKPVGGLGAAVDHMELDLTQFGGDPFETLRFGLRKYGAYNFQYRHLKSTFFHEDILFPGELEDQRQALEGDFVTYDTDRVRDVARLDIKLSKPASLNLGFNRYTRKGDSSTKLRISGVVTPLERPIDEKLNEFDIGFQYRWEKLSVVFREQIRNFENATELFLPGASDRNPDTVILSFFRAQPYDLQSFQHTVRLNLTPNARWLVRASVSLENMRLEGETSESSAVLSGGEISQSATAGAGQVDRDTSWVDVDVSYLLSHRFSITGSFWRDGLDQEGDYSFGSRQNLGAWDMDRTGAEGGVQYALAAAASVSVGLRYESRSVDYGPGEPDLRSRTTSHTGVFLAGDWKPRPALALNAELETGKYDDPFTLASPTDRLRFRAQAKLKSSKGLYGTVTYTAHRIENDQRPEGTANPTDWESDRDQINARVGHRGDGLEVSAGYAFNRVRHDVDQTINPTSGPFLIPILYAADSNFFDARLRWRFHPSWRAGADLRFYDNDGSFAVRRNDLRAYVETTLSDRYLLNMGVRRIDYEEKLRGFNDYDATLVEASIGYAW